MTGFDKFLDKNNARVYSKSEKEIYNNDKIQKNA